MKRKILVLVVSAMMLVTALATIGALPAVAQPSDVSCDWYQVTFDRTFGGNAPDWWAYWCRYPGYGWYLTAWWSSDTGIIWV